MIKIKTITFLVFFILLNNANAQTFGFNGKKNTISIFSTGGIRVFPLAIAYTGFSSEPTLETIKYSSSNQMKKNTTIARCDFRISYTRLVKKNFGIGAEFGYEKFALPMKNKTAVTDVYGNYYDVESIQTTPVFDVFSYMLVFEFYSSRGAAPIGFSSSLGIGPKMYKFDFDRNYRYDQSTAMDNPYPKSSSDIMAINFFYQMNYKKVLNKFMTFEIGMRFHTGIIFPDLGLLSTTTEYSRSQLRDELFVHNLGSLISLRMGFSFLL